MSFLLDLSIEKQKRLIKQDMFAFFANEWLHKQFVKTWNSFVKENKSQFFNILFHLCLSELEVWGQVLGYLNTHRHSFQLYSIFTLYQEPQLRAWKPIFNRSKPGAEPGSDGGIIASLVKGD